jgi:hypothetical protein
VRHSTALMPQPDFTLTGRGTILSNEINATESTDQLIWTAHGAIIRRAYQGWEQFVGHFIYST